MIVAEQLDFEAALNARDLVLRQVDENADDWAKSVIDRAIREVAARGVPFSANDVRPLLPDVRAALVGARFMAAAKSGVIRKVGYVPSSDRGTHGHHIAQWVRA